MAKNYCIYMHKNKINSKIYIGQSCNLNVRWHPISYKDCSYFYNAIQKYGWDNFEHIILEDSLSIEEADQKEKYYIEKYNTLNRDYGYNLKSGGNNSYVLSTETRQKIKKSNQQFFLKHQEVFSDRLAKMHEKAKKKVICLNTNDIFESQLLAAKWAGLKNSAPISRCCAGERKTAGKHPQTGERLQWSFYELKEENNNE